MPFKVFSNGQILTAADVNDYIMEQQIMVFDDATARGTAITAPLHGMTAFLKDSNRLSYYDGSTWRLV